MKKALENSTYDSYEAPRMAVIEMEIEGPILQNSGDNFENGGYNEFE